MSTKRKTMNNICQKIAVTMAGIASCYIVGGIKAAQAVNIITEDFSVNLNGVTLNGSPLLPGGPFAGNTYTGSFKYDADTLASTGSAIATDFSFTFPGFDGVLQNSGLAYTPVFNGSELSLFYAPAPVGSARAFGFNFTNLSSAFIYGTTMQIASSYTSDGAGTVTYTPTPRSTPEPRTISALIVMSLGSFLAKRKLFARKVVD